MASTSSNNPSPISNNNVSRYDVFLSFRGETRHAFTDHLYTALRNAGVTPFRDNNEIDRGEDLKPEIERGIRESRASIVVLSENYATSRWCLDELCLILEQRKNRNHFVLPIFYHVDPSHVRNQTGSFEINVKCDTKWTEDNVGRWKAALKKVGNLTGEVPSGLETEFLKEVVGIIKERLDLKKVYRQANIVGMDAWRKEIDHWLEKSSAQILVVWGMEGSGKTTLARHTVYSNWENFASISILEDIGIKSIEQLHKLQEKLLTYILQGKKRKNPSVWQGTGQIEKALETAKSLIVLDNIVEPSYLFDLLGFGIETQCKIIITTSRESNPHKWFASTSWRCQELEMKPLDKNDSLELLCHHAFGSKAPTEGYDHLVEKALRYCEGNPFAIKVLGSSLSKDNKQFWESTLNAFENELPAKIHNVLVGSYESLPLQTVRDLFLHIACFFVGKDIDYVVKILEPDYSALSGIETLFKSCLLSVSPNKKLMMHRILQKMAKTIVFKESPRDPARRSRVWRDEESYHMLKKGKGSKEIEGLALDTNLLTQGKEHHVYKLSDLNTESFKKMDKLKLLQLNCVGLTGPYENFSEQLRWLCWIGFRLRAIPSDLGMKNLVAIDMSYSCLEQFEPPADLHSLKILNLRGSKDLREIRNICRLRYLEILILWDCISLTHVTLGGLTCLAILNLTGCRKLCMREEISPLVSQEGLFQKIKRKLSQEGSSLHAIKSTQQASFLLPQSLERLYLMNCNLSDTDYFPLTFKDQSLLIYLNLVNSPFELLPSYNYLKSLRVFDVSGCSDLKELRCLPSTLAELYIYYCNSLNIVTFESHRFTLQEFGYEGCVNLCEVEGLFKLMLLTKLEESDLKHMTWLREYQDLKMCLVGDAELTKGRSSCVQMLYEFNIMSTSLPSIKNSNMMTHTDYMYTSQSTLLSFKVPACPGHRRLEGLIITFQYTVHGEDWVWFAKISTPSGVNLMYNPRVFGKPDEVGIWSSYWPIGKVLQIEETVTVSIVVIKGLDIHWCGASLVYTDEGANEHLQENKQCVAVLGEDFSKFQLSTGAYYLCRRDFFELMEAGKLTPDWFRILVDDIIDYTEVGGWRMTGKPEHPYQSYTEVKTIRCITYGPEMEEIYKIAELSKSSVVDKTMESTSELSKAIPMDMVINETMASTPSSLFDKIESSESDLSGLSLQERMDQNIDSAVNLSTSNMFNSKVELSNFLGSIDILPDAYHAILKTMLTYELHTNPSGIPILAFNISPDYAERFVNGEFDLVSSENHSVVDFISTKVNPSFFINKAAIDLYEHFILDLSKLEDQLMHKPLIITGHSLGGYLAILFTLRLQHVVDIQESNTYRKNKRPFCITFGSPLLGDEALQRAISERPTWKSSLLNVVSKTDPLACIFTSQTIYKPFGTFLCCTKSGGYTAFEDQEAILAVLDTMKALNTEKNEMHDYGDNLRSIRRKVLYRGDFESGERHLNSLRAGIILQFKEVGVLGDISNDLILRMETKQAHAIRSHMNTYKPTTNTLSQMKISLAYMEWYMKTTRSKGGYYNSYKNPITKQEIQSKQEILKYKLILNLYWRKFVGEKDLSPLEESAQLRRRWLYSATDYRRIIEPLEIADHYKKGNTNYIRTRQDHYKLLEKWYDRDISPIVTQRKKLRPGSLTVDSLFWAHVEEALIATRDLKDGRSKNAYDTEERLEQFETYLMNGINNFDVSPDIFLDGSSLMKWWKEYKEYKGNSYASEFTGYMNNEAYRSYQ